MTLIVARNDHSKSNEEECLIRALMRGRGRFCIARYGLFVLFWAVCSS